MTTPLQILFERILLSAWAGRQLNIQYWNGATTVVPGKQPTITLRIADGKVLIGLLLHPSLGFGRAYTHGLLTVEGNLQAFLQDVFAQDIHPLLLQLSHLMAYLPRRSSPKRASANARFHYDRGNEFFSLWLDPSMTYSCAYFRTEQDSLETAQQQKLELICKKLQLERGQTLLDVGCGWGSLLFHAMEHYGVRGVGITPSRQQADFITAQARRKGISPDQLTLHVRDWRVVGGTYDRVVSVGMFEHVGKLYGKQFFKRWQSWLKPDGVSLLHTIGAMDSRAPDPWITEAIFPGGYIPSLEELARHARHAGLVVADVENLWRHYALTLQAWTRNFDHTRTKIRELTSEEFARTWWLYLNSSQAAFTTGRLLLWQFILTPGKQSSQLLTREYMRI